MSIICYMMRFESSPQPNILSWKSEGNITTHKLHSTLKTWVKIRAEKEEICLKGMFLALRNGLFFIQTSWEPAWTSMLIQQPVLILFFYDFLFTWHHFCYTTQPSHRLLTPHTDVLKPTTVKDMMPVGIGYTSVWLFWLCISFSEKPFRIYSHCSVL